MVKKASIFLHTTVTLGCIIQNKQTDKELAVTSLRLILVVVFFFEVYLGKVFPFKV